MTIIIALKDVDNKRIIIGADNQGTVGQISIKGGKKIFSLDIPIMDGYGEVVSSEKLYIAMSGNYWLMSYLLYGFDVPPMDKHWDFMYYLYNSFLVLLGECLSANKLVCVDNGMLDSESGMLFVFEGRVYHVYHNLSVMEVVEDFDVDGSASEVAIGSLSTNLNFNKKLDRVEMVRQAVEICGKNSVYCDDDVDLVIVDLS